MARPPRRPPSSPPRRGSPSGGGKGKGFAPGGGGGKPFRGKRDERPRFGEGGGGKPPRPGFGAGGGGRGRGGAAPGDDAAPPRRAFRPGASARPFGDAAPDGADARGPRRPARGGPFRGPGEDAARPLRHGGPPPRAGRGAPPAQGFAERRPRPERGAADAFDDAPEAAPPQRPGRRGAPPPPFPARRRDDAPVPRRGRRGDDADAPPPPARRERPHRAEAGGDEGGGGGAPETESGLVWLHGLHPVAAALANPARRLRRLLLTESGRAALIPKLPPPWRIGPEPVERERLVKLIGPDAVHQGCALLVEPLESPPLAKLLEQSSGPLLVLDQVTDPRNVGAILRSAAAFGAAGAVVQERHAPGETGVLARAASGALEAVPILREVNISRAIAQLKEAGMWVIGLEAGGPVTLAQAASDLRGRRVALVLGAEGEGLRRLTRESCDELARLPIRPAMESLNVASAAAVALYELARAE